MKSKPTKKKWTWTEWLLLLAPLAVVLGLGAMSFAPQLGRAWREWREYGNNRPYAIFYPQMKSEKPFVPYLGLFAFSPDGQKIAISETLSLGSRVGYPTRVWLWRLGAEKPFSYWLASKSKNSVSQVTQLRYVDKNTISASTLHINLRGRSRRESFSAEKRDARNGHLISERQLKTLEEASSPAKLDQLTPSAFPVRFRFHQRKKNGISVKVSFETIEMQRSQDHPNPGKKYVKVHFVADVSDAKKHSSYRFPLASFDDIPRSQGDSGKNVGVAFSPDLRFIFLYVYDKENEPVHMKSSSREYIQVFDTHTRKSLWRQNYSDVYPNYPICVAFSSRGLLAIFRNFDVTELRNAQSGVLLRTIERGQKRTIESERIQFSPNGKLLALPRYGRLELWDVSDLN